MWLIYAFSSTSFYALGEVFQKKGSHFKEEHTELKLLVWFGIFSFIFSLLLKAFGLVGMSFNIFTMICDYPGVILSPLFYALSLILCFLSFKLVPVSVIAPITCMEGAFTFFGVVMMYMFLGKTDEILQSVTVLKLILIILSFTGIYLCGLIQNKIENKEENKILAKGKFLIKSGYFAIIGIVFALLSAVLDSASSLTDIYFLGDIADSYEYIYTHGIIVFVFIVIVYFILWAIESKPYDPFKRTEIPKMLGSGCDSLAMILYMLAVSKNPIFTNIIVSGFCAFTVLFSRIILKEKLEKRQEVCVLFTIICILVFAVLDEVL